MDVTPTTPSLAKLGTPDVYDNDDNSGYRCVDLLLLVKFINTFPCKGCETVGNFVLKEKKYGLQFIDI